jgi:hypothetical protein
LSITSCALTFHMLVTPRVHSLGKNFNQVVMLGLDEWLTQGRALNPELGLMDVSEVQIG